MNQLLTGPGAVIVDMSEVGMLGREGLNVVVRLAARAGEADLGLCLVDGERRLLARRLEEAGLAELFEVCPTVNDARASPSAVMMVPTSGGTDSANRHKNDVPILISGADHVAAWQKKCS